MKFSEKIQKQFTDKFNTGNFNSAEAREFLEPYMTEAIDVNKLIEREKNVMLSRFLHGFKDSEGVREILVVGSTIEEGAKQMSYAFIDKTSDREIIRRQIVQIDVQVSGLQRKRKKLVARQEQIGDQVAAEVTDLGELKVSEAK